MTTCYLVRHGEAAYDLAHQRRLVGARRELVPLTPKGRAQLEELANDLQGAGADLIVTSPITRALESAAILSRRLDLPIQVEFDLHEWLPDLTFTYDRPEIVSDAYHEMKAMGGEWPLGERQNWEPLSLVSKRVLATLQRYLHIQAVIVVCHGVVIESLAGVEISVGTYQAFELVDSV